MKELISDRRVVITGIGVVASNGSNVNDFRESLIAGRSGIRHIAELKEKNFACQIGGVPQVDKSLYGKYFNRGNLGLGDPSSAIFYGCLAAEEAWLDAGLTIDVEADIRWETGVFMGTGIGSIDVIGNKIVPIVNEGNVKNLGSAAIQQCMVSGPSAFIAGLLGLGNQVTTNSSACSTGTEAIIDAYNRIRYGAADRMLAGGSEGYSPYCWGGFDAFRVINRKSNDSPERASRPMSATAAGFVPGSGAGVLVLEEMEFAKARGARIYAEVIGGSINCGGQRKGGSMTAPNSEGVQKCISNALAQSKISAGDVDAISGHLTSTMADPLEVSNWSQVLQRKGKDFPYINSVKSMIGHCLGAAGGIETVAAVLQLHGGFLHPSINSEDLHPEIENLVDKEKIPQTVKKINLNIIAKASFGFGDVNSCLILKRWTDND